MGKAGENPSSFERGGSADGVTEREGRGTRGTPAYGRAARSAPLHLPIITHKYFYLEMSAVQGIQAPRRMTTAMPIAPWVSSSLLMEVFLCIFPQHIKRSEGSLIFSLLYFEIPPVSDHLRSVVGPPEVTVLATESHTVVILECASILTLQMFMLPVFSSLLGYMLQGEKSDVAPCPLPD